MVSSSIFSFIDNSINFE
jgi:hypothetical protein